MMRDSEIREITRGAVGEFYGAPAAASIKRKHDPNEPREHWWIIDPVAQAGRGTPACVPAASWTNPPQRTAATRRTAVSDDHRFNSKVRTGVGDEAPQIGVIGGEQDEIVDAVSFGDAHGGGPAADAAGELHDVQGVCGGRCRVRGRGGSPPVVRLMWAARSLCPTAAGGVVSVMV